MANRSFQDYASSGELLEMYIGGISPDEKIPTSLEVSNFVAAPKNEILLTPQLTAPVSIEGKVFYESSSHSLAYKTDISGVTVNLGPRRVINRTGVIIPDGTPLRQDGIDVTTGLVKVTGALADTFVHSIVLGIATHNIGIDSEGWAVKTEDVNGLDMLSLSDGTSTIVTGLPVYVSGITSGKITMNPPDIATQIGGFLSGSEGSGTNSTLAVKIESNINLPTILAYMNSGSITGTVLDATYRDVATYITFGNVVMDFDETLGTITVPSTGVYDITVNLSLLFAAIGNAEETVILRINGSISGNKDIPVTVPRNGAAASSYPSIKFDAVAGEVIKIQLACTTTTLTSVSLPLMSLDIESKHIR